MPLKVTKPQGHGRVVCRAGRMLLFAVCVFPVSVTTRVVLV